jgi:hypothetical protein
MRMRVGLRVVERMLTMMPSGEREETQLVFGGASSMAFLIIGLLDARLWREGRNLVAVLFAVPRHLIHPPDRD